MGGARERRGCRSSFAETHLPEPREAPRQAATATDQVTHFVPVIFKPLKAGEEAPDSDNYPTPTEQPHGFQQR